MATPQLRSNFLDAHAPGASFTGADLTGVTFERAELTGSSFAAADLSWVTFDERFPEDHEDELHGSFRAHPMRPDAAEKLVPLHAELARCRLGADKH